MTRRRQLNRFGSLVAAPAVLALGGFSSAPAGGSDSAGKASSAPAKIVWQIRGGATYDELVETMLPSFRQVHPNIAVDYAVSGAGNNEKPLTLMVAGERPDVLQSWPPNIWELSAQGQVQNLNDFVKDLKKADLGDFVRYQWETRPGPDDELPLLPAHLRGHGRVLLQ